jgi:DNA-directed RNA polymerase specialized sigma24 family protein
VPEPDDVVGETFVKVVRYIDGFEGDEAAFRTWVFTIGRNLVVDDLRKRTRRPVDVVSIDRLAASGPRGDAEDDAMRTWPSHTSRRSSSTEHRPARRPAPSDLGRAHDPRDRSGRGKNEGAVKMLQAGVSRAIRAKISLGTVTL